ncbi:MAG: glycosyltransferase [Mucilaginibacter sp.]|uniref:glycosyltransferase n=1 Tax=Mucilaginibacter sp. TaxID=1882438 RepID=UPI0031ACF517
MNKKLLIISPYFPPSNAADMQRVRMSLPYFLQFGWEAEVVTVDERYSDSSKDELLLQSLPTTIKVHKVNALDKKWTSKFGLGSLALRSLWFYKQKINRLLKTGKFDLIYFSTTQFPVCILGTYWKKKFGVPFVIDFQDPWHSNYYMDKPKSQRPPKYWFSYRLNKYLEPIAMRHVDGLISVSAAYLTDLSERYPTVRKVPAAVIPFGFDENDVAVARANQEDYPDLLSAESKNLVYVGRGGEDMYRAIIPLFECLQSSLLSRQDNSLSAFRIYFIGTSYAPAGQGKPSIQPLALAYGLQNHVVEISDRISFYHTLSTLQQADALFLPGSDDPKYTASKLYPYLLSGKPILAIFNSDSPALKTLHHCGAEHAYGYQSARLGAHIHDFIKQFIAGTLPKPVYKEKSLDAFSAVNMTRLQSELFHQITSG